MDMPHPDDALLRHRPPSIAPGDWDACRKCELDGVEKRVGRGHALLSPLCQAIAANAALVIGDVNGLGWPALHRLDLDRRALQRPVLQQRLHRSSIRRADLLLKHPEVDEGRSAALRGVPSVRWSCGQRFPAEGAVRRRLAWSSAPRQPTFEANGIVDRLQGQFSC